MQGSKHAWLGLFAIVFFGCNQSPESSPTAEGARATEAPVAERLAAPGGMDEVRLAQQDPKQTVELFLTSLREGDDASTSRLLTAKARSETAKHDMIVRPPGSQTAHFVVGQIIYTTERRDIAHVESNWADIDDAGRRQNYEIVWIVRKDLDGWGVAGMATELFAGEAPLVMNFEDPLDMLAQQQRAELELTRRNSVEASTSEVIPASHSAPLR